MLKRGIHGTRASQSRDRSGALKAFYNVCMHRAHTLVQDERGRANFITCPYHAWSYDAQGKLRTVPDEPDFDKALDCRAKHLVPIRSAFR